MNSKTTPKIITGVALLLLCVFTGTGCWYQTVEQKEAQRSGAEMQRSGIMSQGDYVKVRELAHQVTRTHAISESDLDWDLAFLQGTNIIGQARAITVLSQIRPMTAAQKSKITAKAAPYMNHPDVTYEHAAARVRQTLSMP